MNLENAAQMGLNQPNCVKGCYFVTRSFDPILSALLKTHLTVEDPCLFMSTRI